MSNTILSVMSLIYCETIDMIFYFHYFGMLEEWAVKYIMLHCDYYVNCKICL